MDTDPYTIGVARYIGYRKALREAQVEFDPELVFISTYLREGGQQVAEEILIRQLDITALLCANDEAALGSLLFFRKQGIRVPERISLIGFDNSKICDAMSPSLTSVDFNPFQTGIAAVRRLDNLFKENAGEMTVERGEPRLVIRDSTCAPGTEG